MNDNTRRYPQSFHPAPLSHDVFGGDKVEGDKVEGNKTENHYNSGTVIYTAYTSSRSVLINPTTIRPSFAALEDSVKHEAPFQDRVIVPIYAKAIDRCVVVVQVPPEAPGRWLLAEVALTLRRQLKTLLPNIAPPQIREYSDYEDETGFASEAGRIEVELRTLSEPTILLLTRAARHQLGWDWDQLSHIAAHSGHYVLAVTSTDFATWDGQKSEGRYWHAVQTTNLFRDEYLTAFLRQRLIDEQIHLPYVLREKTSAEAVLVEAREELTVREVATKLQKPFNIDSWTQEVIRAGKNASPQNILVLINENADQDLKRAVHRWFYRVLKPHEQLLALALCLFDGLEKTQLLTALQELRENVWGQLGDVGGIIDHVHLLSLRAFFRFQKLDNNLVRVESLTDAQRDVLLDLALENHAMHLRKIMPWFLNVVKQSSSPGAHDSLLHPTKESGRALRQIVSEDLSDIGLRAIGIVHPTFVELLASKQAGVYTCLAHALALWVTHGHTTELFNLLSNWLQDEQLRKRIDTSSEGLVHGAVVVSISYVLRDTQPNHVPTALIELLAQAAQVQTTHVHHRLRTYMVSQIPRHFRQLDTVLRLLVRDSHFRSHVVNAATETYKKDRVAVEKLIHCWMVDAQRDINSWALSQNVQQAEAMLVTVAQILEVMTHEAQSHSIFDDLVQKLSGILQAMRHPAAREDVWNVCINVSQGNDTLLATFLGCLQDSDILIIQKRLLIIDREQRRLVSTSELSTLPMTPVQRALLRLLTVAQSTSVRQMAIQLLGAIANRIQPSLSRRAGEMHHTFYRQTLAPYLVLQAEREEVRQITHELLRLVRELHAKNSQATRLMLHWLRQEQNPLICDVGRCLTAIIKLDGAFYWGEYVHACAMASSLWLMWRNNKMPDEIEARYAYLFLRTVVALAIILFVVVLLFQYTPAIAAGLIAFVVLSFYVYQEVMHP